MRSAVNLANSVRIGRHDLPEPTPTKAAEGNLLGQEVSAVTFNQDTGTLFIVGDAGTYVTQVTTKGELINSMTLAKGSTPQGTAFYDPEGIADVGSGKFLLVEERDRQALEFTSYDSQTSRFIFVKQIDPQGLFQTTIDFKAIMASNGSPTAPNAAATQVVVQKNSLRSRRTLAPRRACRWAISCWWMTGWARRRCRWPAPMPPPSESTTAYCGSTLAPSSILRTKPPIP